MSPPIYLRACRDRQRGAIGLIAAITMATALLCMLVVIDTGRLYLEKRSLQRVADMAALEAAGLSGICSGSNTASTYAITSATRNGFTVSDNTRTLTTQCGTLSTGADNRRAFTVDSTKSDAIRVTVSHAVPRSIAAGIGALFDSTPTSVNIQLTATATATPALPPLAQLSIRTTLASVNIDQTRAGSLSAALSALLGTQVNLDLASWSGLVDTDINLLQFANQLAIAVNVKAGDYDTLLTTNATLTQLVTASISALQQSGATASATAAIKALTTLQTAVAGITTPIKLGDLLNLQTGTPAAGLNTGLQAFQLVQTLAQLANSKNAASSVSTLGIPGIATITATVKVIEPPQFSAIGNPATTTLYVRTAQTKALVSINLPILNGISGLVSTVSGLTGSLTSTLNGLLHLNLSAVGCLLGTKCTQTDPLVLPTGPKIDLGIELAAADAHVTGFNCTSDATKSLSTTTDNALVTVRAGTIDQTAFFSTTGPATVSPLPIVDIGTKACSYLLIIIPLSCDQRIPYAAGGIGLTLNSSVVGTGQSVPHVFANPPNLNLPSATFDFSNTNDLVASITNTLTGVTINQYGPATGGSVLGSLLATTAGTFNTVASLVGAVVKSTLSPLLDPILNTVLQNLGIEIAKVRVGANLSCHPGQATLVI